MFMFAYCAFMSLLWLGQLGFMYAELARFWGVRRFFVQHLHMSQTDVETRNWSVLRAAACAVAAG